MKALSDGPAVAVSREVSEEISPRRYPHGLFPRKCKILRFYFRRDNGYVTGTRPTGSSNKSSEDAFT
jgi:hypothetical protein